MSLPYTLLDVFADEPFQGTQIPVVCLKDGSFSDAAKTAIASEFQQTETVFLDETGATQASVYNSKGASLFGAHTIIAASYMAFEKGLAQDQGGYASFQLEHQNQKIECFIDKQENGPGSLQYARTISPTIDRYTPEIARLAAALNTEERHISFSKYKPMVVSVDKPVLIIPFTRPEHVLAASINSEHWEALLGDLYTSDLFLVAPGSITGTSHFHGRLISPDLARDYYPPIGNAMAEFIAYLANQNDMPDGTHTFTIDRGSLASRKSILHVEFDKREGRALKCRIGGHVIKMGAGELFYN